MKLIELLELTQEKKLEVIAKEGVLPCGVKKFRAIMIDLGCKPNGTAKSGWNYENVKSEDLEKDLSEFVAESTASKKERTEEPKSQNTFEPKNEGSAETKNNSTNELNHDTIKELDTKPTNQPKSESVKEGKSKLRKRASFDIDASLLKELKIFAITEDKNVYEIVERAIRAYLKEGK